jgi:hypothetical protein
MRALTIIKILLMSAWLSIGASAFAQNQNGQGGNGGYHGAPAPLIGAGVPVALAVGGVLLGAKLLKRRK